MSRRAIQRHLLGLERSPDFGNSQDDMLPDLWIEVGIGPKIGDDVLEDVFTYT
jgi:hypothetical protein